MYNFNKRIYNLNVKKFFLYTSKYFFFLVNHRSNEMIKQAFFYGLKWNGFRYTNLYHMNKVYLCNSTLVHKTFDFNNYVNFFFLNKFVPPLLFFSNSFYTTKYYKSNLKNSYLNYFFFFQNKFKNVFFSNLFSMYNIKHIKFYTFFMYFFFFYVLNKKYLSLLNYKSFNIINF